MAQIGNEEHYRLSIPRWVGGIYLGSKWPKTNFKYFMRVNFVGKILILILCVLATSAYFLFIADEGQFNKHLLL